MQHSCTYLPLSQCCHALYVILFILHSLIDAGKGVEKIKYDVSSTQKDVLFFSAKEGPYKMG